MLTNLIYNFSDILSHRCRSSTPLVAALCYIKDSPFPLLLGRENGAVTVTTVSVAAVTVTNDISFASVAAGDGEDEVRVVRLGVAGLAGVVQQEAVAVSGSENECLASAELLASIAAVCCGAGAIGDSVEIGTDSRSVVGDIDSIVGSSIVAEVGAKRIQVGTRVIDGRARNNGGSSGGGGNSASLKGCREGSHAGCVCGSNG
jgi:hypothetical protein